MNSTLLLLALVAAASAFAPPATAWTKKADLTCTAAAAAAPSADGFYDAALSNDAIATDSAVEAERKCGFCMG
jgi:hypothetical protein